MSVYFNTYVPSLKEEAEIDHLSDVEKEFLSFSSDLENAVWQKSEGRLSRSFELGGGDVFLSSIKSGGVLEVEEDFRLFNITNTTGTNYTSSLVEFSYEPISNFWQDQGYSWQYGYVNLTTGYGENETTPLQYTNMNETIQAVENDSGIFSSLFDMEYMYNLNFEKDTGGKYTGNTSLNCTKITLIITNFEKGDKDYVSGNGVAMLTLETEINKRGFINETQLNFTVNDDALMGVNDTIWKCINDKLVDFNSTIFNNVDVISCNLSSDAKKTGENCLDTLGITFKDNVSVNIKYVNMTVSAKV